MADPYPRPEPPAGSTGRPAQAPDDGTEPVLVRPAARADLDAIVAIEQASFSDPWQRRSFESLLADRRVYFSVVSVGGAAAGYVVAWFVSDEGEIANLAVAPERRGRGLGALLLDAAVGEARARGAAVIYLEVRESNRAARRLYESRGFGEVTRRHAYYRRPVEDALVLRLRVPPA